jgi:hypothetical protein
MKKTLNEIKVKISKVANSKREDAGYGGRHDDGGASSLEDSLSMFLNGVKSATDAYLDKYIVIQYKVLSDDTEYEVPSQWEKYFLEDDKEYQDYLRLKNKFEKNK